MSDIIAITYEPLDDNLNKASIEEVTNKAVRGYGEAYANAIIKMYQKWLRPGGGLPGRNPIGASGAASQNFKPETRVRGGKATVYVIEGGATPANAFIRKGIPAGQSVSLQRLKLWAARKGIQFLSSAEYKSKHGGKDLDIGKAWTYGKAIKIGAYDSKSGKGDPFQTKTHGRAEPGKKDVVNSALKAIENALFQEGTDRPGSNWYRYFPKHADGFDYPRYLVVQRKTVIEDMNYEYADNTAAAMVAFWNSGGKTRVFDYKIGELGGTRAAGKGEF